MAYVYLGVFIISIVFGMALLYIGKKQNISVFSLVFLCTSVSCGGYALQGFAQTIDAALVGNTVSYFGNYFGMLFVLMVIARLMHIKFPTAIYVLIALINLAFVLMIATIPYHSLYYVDYSLVQSELGASYIDVTQYGPLHYLHYVMLAFYVCASLVVMLPVALHGGKKVSVRHIVLLFLIELNMVVLYALNITALSGLRIEVTPFALLLSEVIILVIIWNLSMYEVSGHIQHTLADRMDHGYLVLDKKRRFIASDEQALVFFPEIRDLQVDSRLETYAPAFAARVDDWIEQTNADTSASSDEKVKLRVVVTEIRRMSTISGYLIEFYDDTARIDYTEALNHSNEILNRRVAEEVRHISEMQNRVIVGLATMVDKRDEITGSHIFRTSSVVKIMIDHLREEPAYADIPEDFWSCVVDTAPLHDIGKITISDSVLRKPGKYTPEEYDIMKTHTTAGAKILSEILESINDPEYIRIAENIALHHHERYDGSGYPQGLSGKDIPLESRIMAIADVYDALVSRRSYKEAFTCEKATEIIRSSFGTQFDPDLKPCFENSVEELTAFYTREFATDGE